MDTVNFKVLSPLQETRLMCQQMTLNSLSGQITSVNIDHICTHLVFHLRVSALEFHQHIWCQRARCLGTVIGTVILIKQMSD